MERPTDHGHPTRQTGVTAGAPGGQGPALEQGEQIGPYRLLKPLGEGGFGVVYLAERREPMVQRVALKVIKPGMDSAAVIARFEQERQALAVMDHPNIARVLDGGVTSAELGSRPYFVMEYVKGEPITDYCDRHRLSIRQRLLLFTQACEAVQHAHHKGVIHRDIKPSNVLVSVPDTSADGSAEADGNGGEEATDRGIVKIIDFGVAKAISHTLTDKTIFTETGQIIGTPEYMSPEQAEAGALDIDTRTDVYSLGVLLYELLTGHLPFDSRTLRSRGYDEIRRVIREVEPPKPSTRLTGGNAVEADTIARARGSDARRLSAALARELEWIPLKAMRKDRTRRYASPLDLARDVRNYLGGMPLTAGPESAAYRLRKFAARHRTLISAAAAFVIVLAGATAVSIAFARSEAEARLRAVEAQERYKAERDVSRAAVGFLDDDLFGRLDPSVDGPDATLASLLDRVSGPAASKPGGQPAVQFQIHRVLGRAYLGIGRPTEAEAQLAAAIGYGDKAGAQSTQEYADAVLRLNEARYRQGPSAQTVSDLRAAVAEQVRVRGPDDALALAARNQLAGALKHTGELDEAEREYRSVLADRTRVLGASAEPTLITAYNLGLIEHERGMRARKAGDDEAAIGYFSAAAATFGDIAERARSALGVDHELELTARYEHAGALMRMRKYEDALAAFDAVVPGMRQKLGRNHWRTLEAGANRGIVLLRMERYGPAVEQLEDTLGRLRVIRGESSPQTAAVAGYLASALDNSGRSADAIGVLERAYREQVDQKSPAARALARRLAELFSRSGDSASHRTWIERGGEGPGGERTDPVDK